MGEAEIWSIFTSVIPPAPQCALSLRWRHNGHDCVSNHQPRHCLLNRLFGRRSKKTSKLRATGLCVGNSLEAGEFPAQMASNAENVSIWWRHHGARVNWLTTAMDIAVVLTDLLHHACSYPILIRSILSKSVNLRRAISLRSVKQFSQAVNCRSPLKCYLLIFVPCPTSPEKFMKMCL